MIARRLVTLRGIRRGWASRVCGVAAPDLADARAGGRTDGSTWSGARPNDHAVGSALQQRLSAVDPNLGAADVTGLVRSQKGDQLSDLFGRS